MLHLLAVVTHESLFPSTFGIRTSQIGIFFVSRLHHIFYIVQYQHCAGGSAGVQWQILDFQDKSANPRWDCVSLSYVAIILSNNFMKMKKFGPRGSMWVRNAPSPGSATSFHFSCHELQRKCCHIIFRPDIAPLLCFLLIGLIVALWLVLTYLFPKLVSWGEIVSISPCSFHDI